MGWYGRPPRRGRMYRGGGFWFLPLAFIGLMVFTSRAFFFFLPILIVLGVIGFAAFFFLRPMLMSMGMGNRPPWDSEGRGEDWFAGKRKRDFDDMPYEDQKAKRTPRYVMSDDGEPLEVIEEEKHKPDNPDDIDYV